MKRAFHLGLVLLGLCLVNVAQAQDLTSIVGEGNYRVLGGETVTSSAAMPEGWAPVNGNVAFVYDPEFHFFMRGYITDPAHDRRAQYRDVGYVVVAAAGDPGGYYRTTPAWITHESFTASFANGQVDLSYRYGATYVPVMRGFQGFIIYANLAKQTPGESLYVYDDALTFGRGNYLLTGDGPDQAVSLQLASEESAEGVHGIEVKTTRQTPGTHWKLMLFARGSAAAFDGIDLRAYDKLVFQARASREVWLQGGFGTGDDSGARSLGPLHLTTEYQRFEVDLSGVDRSDINTLLWVYLHKALNPVDYTDLSVFLDSVELVPAP